MAPKFLSSDGDSCMLTTTDLQITTVVEIGDGGTTRRMLRFNAGTRLARHIVEPPIATVPVKQSPLVKGLINVGVVDGGVDMTICDENILPAVLIEVEKSGSPAEELCVNSQPRRNRLVGKKASLLR